jgi:hypothetical protein
MKYRKRDWNPELEQHLPDCRLRDPEQKAGAGIITIGRMQYYRVHCANCGKPAGLATMAVTHIFYLCDICAKVREAEDDTLKRMRIK